MKERPLGTRFVSDALEDAGGFRSIDEVIGTIHIAPEIDPTLRSMAYDEYLKTQHWRELRERILWRAGFRCRLCETHQGPIDVHHLTYERRGCEFDSDLIALCRDCHTKQHGIEQ